MFHQETRNLQETPRNRNIKANHKFYFYKNDVIDIVKNS